MKLWITIICIVGVFFSLSETSRNYTVMEQPLEVKEQAADPIVYSAVYAPSLVESIEVIEPVTEKAELTLDEVEGISLYDTPADVILKLGEPIQQYEDSFWAEMTIYEYEHFTIAFYDQQLEYLETVGAVEEIVIDGQAVALTEQGLRDWLGEPDYIAEDGIVFQRGEALLKLFLDEETGRPLYASYYHIASV